MAARLVQFAVRPQSAVRIVGKAIYPEEKMTTNPIPAFWGQCFGDGTFEALEGMPDNINKDVSPDAYVGFMYMGDPAAGEGRFTYICGMAMLPGTPVPEGFVSKDIPACDVAVGWIQGQEHEIYAPASGMTREALQAAGYRSLAGGAAWEMELYACPRFTTPDENGEVILDYLIPVKSV